MRNLTWSIASATERGLEKRLSPFLLSPAKICIALLHCNFWCSAKTQTTRDNLQNYAKKTRLVVSIRPTWTFRYTDINLSVYGHCRADRFSKYWLHRSVEAVCITYARNTVRSSGLWIIKKYQKPEESIVVVLAPVLASRSEIAVHVFPRLKIRDECLSRGRIEDPNCRWIVSLESITMDLRPQVRKLFTLWTEVNTILWKNNVNYSLKK